MSLRKERFNSLSSRSKVRKLVMTAMLMTTMTAYLEVREDMERGLLLSRGSVPTGGLCCGRLQNEYEHQ